MNVSIGPRPRQRYWSAPGQRLRVIGALMVRDMGSRFGRASGGYMWAILEPLGGILLLSLAFGLALRNPPLGTSFMLFYATGVVPFSMFNMLSKSVGGAVQSNKGLLSYPVVSLLDAVFAKVALNFVTSLLVATLILGGIITFNGLHVNLDIASALLSVSLAALLGTGIGALNCVLFGFFPTWKNFWGVLTRPLFLLSGVFFTFESVPPAFQKILWWNPLVHVVGLMRAGFYGSYDAGYVSIPYVLGIALATFVLGSYLMRRHASALIEQ